VGRKIALGQRSLQNCKPLAQVLLWPLALLFSTIAHRFMGKFYVADDGCNSCGLCIRACPVKAIKLRDGRPRWSWSCEACQRCINLCPQRAIPTSNLRALMTICLMFSPLDSWMGLDLPYVFPKVILWSLAYPAAVYFLDQALASLERMAWIGRITRFSFTKGFRRYLAPGYYPSDGRSVEVEKSV
jgi:NAD-dependent dihydropyrimidine dehydrogenase PreA subunit